MSVILFTRTNVFKELADGYEGLKHLLLPYGEINDAKFYKSLRRLYFANVATYLCQYHDDTPLSPLELQAIDPFQELQGENDLLSGEATKLRRFIEGWSSLRYNLITNEGEIYTAKEAEQYIKELIDQWTRRVLETYTTIE